MRLGGRRLRLWEGEPAPGALAEVRRALDIERRHGRQPHAVEVLGVRPAEEPPDQGPSLWRLELAWTGERTAGVLEGGELRQAVGAGPPRKAWLVEVDARSGEAFVEADAATPPVTGPGDVFPFDFLAAVHALAFQPSLQPLREVWLQGLAAAENVGRPLSRPVPGLPAAWGHGWALVWGPPGTGKTHTLVHAVADLLDDPSERVLVVSTTNRATDEVALRLGALLQRTGRGCGAAVRAGRIVRPSAFREAGVVAILPGSPDVHAALDALRRDLSAATEPAQRARLKRRLAHHLAALPSVEDTALDPECRVVLTTRFSALRLLASRRVEHLLGADHAPFTTVVLDEAGLVGRAQAAALSVLASRRTVLAGDPRQLAPIVRAERTMAPEVSRWLSVSALEHLDTADREAHVQRLTVQHRMHPDLRRAVAAFQYDGDLTDAGSVQARPWPGAGTLASLPRAQWYVLDAHPGVRGPDLASKRGPSGSRQRVLLAEVLEALHDKHSELASLEGLLLTPYRAQRDLAHQHLQRLGWTDWRAATVHAVQGAQADIVLFDTVHASSTSWSRAGWERLVNVGLSRARHLGIVVASRREMDQPFLRTLRDHLAPRVLRGPAGRRRWLAPPDPGRAEPVPLFGRTDLVEPVPPRLASEAAPTEPHARAESLGAQIARRRQLRPVFSREQQVLIHRELSDAGPRLVRGVAGSGKSLVLAHWAARLLRGQGVPRVAVVYANRALRPLLERMLDEAWRAAPGAPGRFPSERVHLVHVGDLLHGLLREHDLAWTGHRYDYPAMARLLLDRVDPGPRFPAVFIDEAQDLGHDTLELMIRLTEPQPDGRRPVMVFYDDAQDVYGRPRPVWSRLGLDLQGRSDVMRESFRSTRPILEVALMVMDRLRPLEDSPGMRDLLRPRTGAPLVERAGRRLRVGFCEVEGQTPRIDLYGHVADEARAVTERVRAWLEEGVRPGDIRVVTMGGSRRAGADGLKSQERLVRALQQGLPGLSVATAVDGPSDAVVVATPHALKGYDAEVVLVAGADGFAHSGLPDAAALYVAMTRARSLLHVTATRAEPGTPSAAITAALEDVRALTAPASP